MLFKVYFADNMVPAVDSLVDHRQYTSLGCVLIIRFHNYTPGNSYCVYELTTVFAMPVKMVSLGDPTPAGSELCCKLEEQALLGTVCDFSNYV